MIEEFITSRIRVLGPDYRAFVESEYVTETAATFAAAEGFTERQLEVLENAILLYLLLIFSKEETIDFIARNCDLAPSEAILFWFGITSTLPEGMETAIEVARATMTSVPPEAPAGATPLANEIAETEEALWSLSGIHTMADDMKASGQTAMPAPAVSEEQIHSSSQADILPNGNTVPEPRWESEVK